MAVKKNRRAVAAIEDTVLEHGEIAMAQTKSALIVEPHTIRDMNITTTYSPKKRHCYLWVVVWDDQHPLLAWCLLNPAEETTADINRTGLHLRAITENHGNYGGFYAVNLLSFVSTDPLHLQAIHDPIGPDNDSFLRETARTHHEIVCAWGNDAPCLYVHRALSVFEGTTLLCPGTTKLGNPRHPGRLAYETKLTTWLAGTK